MKDMKNVKQWHITVEAVTQAIETAGRAWTVTGKDDAGKDVYGYTPETQMSVTRSDVVYDQRTDDLDLQAIVAVVNGLQAPDVAIVAGGVDLTARSAKEMALASFGWSRNVHTGDWKRTVVGRAVPDLSGEGVEFRTLQELCLRLADLHRVATRSNEPLDEPAASEPGGTKEGPIERHPNRPSPAEVGTRLAALIQAGYVHSHGFYVHAQQRKILTPQWVNETDLSRFISGIASFNDSPEHWTVLSMHPIPEEVYQRIVEHCKVQ